MYMKRLTILILTALFIMNFEASSQTKTSQNVVKFVIHTDYGDMKGFLYNETPQHRDNFKKNVEQGYYDGLLFHRVISGFMIQGGDPDSRTAKAGQRLGSGGPGYTVPAEINPALIHKKGALSAARTGDQVNPQKASSGSQFYIVQGKKQTASQLSQGPMKYTDAQKQTYETIGGTPFLDGGYTVFGEISEGLEVIDKIAAVQKDASDRPVQDVKMTIKIVK
jgi:cyclophilin family peptidyl-prolyl cis-trans isomerase